MAQKPLSPAIAREALDAHAAYGSNRKAAEALGIPTPTFQARITRARGMQAAGELKDIAPPQPIVACETYDEAWAKWQGIIGQTKERYTRPAQKLKTGDVERVVIASDFHVPFHHGPHVAEMLRREDADVLIVGGDLQDFYSVSRFTKYERVNAFDELAATTLMIEQLASTFPKVVIVEGNHDRPRFEKALRAQHCDVCAHSWEVEA